MNSVRDAVQTSIISYLKGNNFPVTREAYLGVAFGDSNIPTSSLMRSRN